MSSSSKLTRSEALMVALFLAGTMLAVLNQTLLSPALPSIMRDMSIDAMTAQWLTSGYALVEVVVIPSSAYLIGRFSTRKLYIAGLVSFAAGSLLVGIAPTFAVMMVGRMLQALCTGVVMAMVMTVILLLFPVRRRGTAMGLITLVISFAPAVGPSVSGIVVDSLGWRPLFVIVAAVTVCLILLAVVIVKNFDGFERERFDAPSAILAALSMVPLIYGLSSIARSDDKLAPAALIAVGAVLLVLFVRRQLKSEQPYLNIRTLSSPRYAVAMIVSVVSQVVTVGLSVIMPLYIQGVLGQSATATGLCMLPGSLLGAFASIASGRLFDRIGPRPIVLTGCGISLVGMAGMCLFTETSSMVYVTACYSVMLFGLMCVGTPLSTWGVNSLPNNLIQHANAVTNTLNQVGASAGTALLVSLTTLPAIVAAMNA